MNKLSLTIKIGSLVNHIPYTCIPYIGSVYDNTQKEISFFEELSIEEKKNYFFYKIYKVVKFAIDSIPFYKDFYLRKGFDLSVLKSYEDITKIPIITKGDLMNVALEDRSCKIKDSYVANTGGSSGVPLTFYRLKNSRIKEMAYYHSIWRKLGYEKSKVRLQFVGRQNSSGCKYDLSRNQLRVSVYEPFENVLKELAQVNNDNIIEYLQGYPSVLYEFSLYCQLHQDEFVASHLNISLKGIFLNSEYPYPPYRKIIEEVFNVKTIAGYGHTEGLVLAMDFGDENYIVQQSYGYAEVIEMEDGKHLIGTTYDNYASPLIRYDTNDIMDEVTINDGILYSFKMTNGGRNGQYIEDKNGKKISLTGLIFGKHHDLFKYCSQLQISQSKKGKATVYYVPMKELPSSFNPGLLFDSGNIDIDFSFKDISEPIKTKAGKVLLLVKEQND